MKLPVLAAALCCLLPAAQPAWPDEAPLSLGAPYPGDFSWLRWRFSTDDAGKAKWAATMRWARLRETERTDAARQNLLSVGVGPQTLETGCYGDETCKWILDGDQLAATFESWDDFERALNEAQPYFRAYDLAAHNAVDIAAPDADATLGAKLSAMRMGDQIYLMASAIDPTNPPLPLSLPATRLFRVLATNAAEHRIHGETAMLKDVVRKQGWPKISDVGPDAAEVAWLIAQHSDDDPAFQWTALHLMEPLVTKGEAKGARYAYLYDRVMLKLDGKQRYGTQFQCTAGRMVPQALEDGAKVGDDRKQMGLPPIAEYAKRFPAHCEDIGAK